MPRTYKFDFTGAPPQQGAVGSDHIPPGTYALRLDEIDMTESKSHLPMVVARLSVVQAANGDKAYAGKRLVEYFVLETEKGEKAMGLNRMHAFLLAIGIGVSEAAYDLDFDLLVTRTCYAVVKDETMEASGKYEERTVSRVDGFYSVAEMRARAELKKAQDVAETNAKAAAAQAAVTAAQPGAVAAPAQVAVAQPVAAPVATAVAAPVAAPAPPPVAVAAAPAAPVAVAAVAAAPAAAIPAATPDATASVLSEMDALFPD